MEIIYGRNAVSEALKSQRPGAKVTRLLIAEGVQEKSGGPVDSIQQLATSHKPPVPVKRLPRQELDRLTQNANHQGVAAEVPPYAYVDFDQMLKDSRATPEALFLVLDSIQDPQNLGTLFRSAEAVGVTGVILPERRAAGITPAVRNASSGAVEHLQIAQVVNLPRALEQLKENDIWVAGLEDEPKAVPYDQAALNGRLAIVVGSEGPGLGRLVREKCDFFIILPMLGKIASLNAAVAGSIALYEALRQRRTAAKK
ncbi:MAG TPA: 23S rRNA (guanosine(2251)-2'-O)-methyltransferase RlmB [Chloroflexia bacterium]|nr:23S rRNA (guanosine(2251)-2'-O)-methyltransferase RlmB [Chloroflexia bacterium]